MGVMVTERRRGLHASIAAALPLLALVVALLLLPQAAAGAVVSVKASPAAFSPNGDKVQDTVRVSVRLARAGKLFVGVYDPDGRLVKKLQPWRKSKAATRTYIWSGLLNGEPRANGDYTVRAKVATGRRTKAATCRVTLDALPPEVSLTDGGASRVFAGAESAFGYAADGSLSRRVELQVFTAAGEGGSQGVTVATVAADHPGAAGTVTWNGAGAVGGFVATGRYKVRFAATDAAGNVGVSRFEPIVVYAPTEVSGSVRSSAGSPVADATVSVGGTSLTTTTAADGSFEFAACPMGFRIIAASANGLPGGSQRVKVNLDTAAVSLVLGQTAPRARDSSGSEVTISGTLYYGDKDDDPVPMRNVRVVLQDDATVCWDDIRETHTDQSGSYSFTYDYVDEWDSVGYPDVRVIAYAEDGDRGAAAVYHGYDALEPYFVVATDTWDNNASSHTDQLVTAVGPDRMIYFILDCIQTAHDRWRQLTGYDAPSVWVDYPVDLSIVSAQFVITALDVGPTDHYISIDRDNDPWSPALIYHEYGHSLHFHSYTCQNLGLDSNAYAAYNGVTGYSFQKNGTSFGEQDNNAQWESEGGAWAALKEGFADFFAAVNMGWDRGAIANTLERNVDHPAVNDDKAAHSISRALWDVYDTDLTSLCCWGSGDDWTAWTAIVRPVGPLGSGDDDRIRATSNLQMLSRVWTVMDEDWPASISELRSRVRSRYAAESGNLRLLDTVLRANGLCAGDIANTRPSIGNARVTSDNAAGPPHRGVVRVYCEVTDPDVAGGQRDSDHVKVRLDYGVTSAYPPYGTTWYPVGFTLAKASAPPPGESGEYWYVIDWDTTTQSPCESMYDDGLYGYFWNEQRETTQILGRRENVKLRLIATDDMQDSAAVEVPPFTVNNPVGDQGFYGFISKPWGDGFQGIAGATVQLRQGADSPTGQLVDTTASNEFGVYSFEGVPAGAYTVVASKSGFTTNWRNTTVVEGEYKGWQDLVLTPVGPASMRSVRGGCIRWTAGVSSPTGTYEFWYRPVGTLYGTEWGSQVAQVSRDYPDWMGDGLHRFSSMEISYREVPVGAPGGYASVFVFGIAENADSGDPNEPGIYHQLSGTTPIELEHWYHVAAVYGSYGMKLFVNGHLEASNDYTGAPQAFDGVAAGGWFCLGDNYLAGRPQTASGDYRGLRVSSVQRYSADFSPVDVPASDASTDILDALAGTTNGENHGFVPTPVTP